MYLNDNELLELTLATIDQMGTYFFLILECQKGRICYASSSVETILGYKPVRRNQNFVLISSMNSSFLYRLNYIYNLYLKLSISMILK
jgi:hypothetical protein